MQPIASPVVAGREAVVVGIRRENLVNAKGKGNINWGEWWVWGGDAGQQLSIRSK